MISIRKLYKTYKGAAVPALNGIGFDVRKGEIFGLAGPDGSGKTTLFRILATLLEPDQGMILMQDMDVVREYRKIRKIIGYMPGRFSLYPDLSVSENLRFFATIHGTTPDKNFDIIRPIYESLEPFKHRPAGKLSGGMKQKLALCSALIHQPSVLLLDEPTTGVDPVSRKDFWDILEDLRVTGMTIMVSTPYMDEAARCDRIGLIRHGQIMALDTPHGIIQQFPKPLYSLKAPNIRKILPQIKDHKGVDSCYSFGNSLHITLREGYAPERIFGNHGEMCRTGFQWDQIQPTIEDCFIQLMHTHEN